MHSRHEPTLAAALISIDHFQARHRMKILLVVLKFGEELSEVDAETYSMPPELLRK